MRGPTLALSLGFLLPGEGWAAGPVGRRPGWLCEDFYFYPLPKGQGPPGMGTQSLRSRLGAELLPSDLEPLAS